MDDVKIYRSDATQVNSMEHMNYGQYLQYTEKKQELPGFDAEYLDIVDYILKITHRIWEEKGVGIIYDTYAANCLVHTGDTTAAGVQGVVSGTLATLHAFPDRRVLGEEVIWSEDSPGVFLSSHRNMSTGTNLGESTFGPATGKKVIFRNIADCACSNNLIYEEWLARDNLWLALQLGVDPWELAGRMAAGQPVKQAIGRDENMEGQFAPKVYVPKDDSVGEAMLRLYNDVYNCKLVNRVCEYYASNAVMHAICNKDLIGHDEIQGGIISLLSSFPNARMSVDRVTCNDHPDGTCRAAVRWHLRGLHEGIGAFGQPTGKPVEIMGIAHYLWRDGKIAEAWEVFDALDVMRQLRLGDVPASSEE